jgi:tetratricopeptide (TPR) repeat protein
MLQAQIWSAKGDVAKAVDTLERLANAFPKLPALKYQLGRAYAQSKNLTQAVAALNQAIALNPDYPEAALLLAELNLRQGNADAVVAPMLELSTKRPDIVPAHLLLADAYRALGRLEDAAQVVRKQIAQFPDSAQPYLILGLVQRLQNKNGEARKSFEQALERAPDNLTIVYQLVDLDIAEKKFAAAHARVQEKLEKKADSAAPHFLEGRIFAAEENWDAAEKALKKSLELDPNGTSAYQLLVSVYVAANKLPEAVAQLETFLAKNPDNLSALMTLATIHDQTNDYQKARGVYERLLAANPEFAPGLNNLAYLYSERFNDPEKAYELGRKARGLNADDPRIADTLGWILYKRGEYQQAFALLQESAAKLNMPEVQFHFGMASYMMNDLENARVSLRKAVDAPGDYPGKDAGKQRLAALESGNAAAAEMSVADAKTAADQNPKDPIARMRLAEAYEKSGDAKNAAQESENALKINAKLFPATLKLAQLYGGPLKDNAKALEYARKARELAPNDPRAAGTLGKIAIQTGNASWAYGLLQESIRALPDDPGVLHSFAWASYRMSRVKEAQEAMEKVIEKAPANSPDAADAKRFLALTRVDVGSPGLASARPEIDAALAADKEYLPALMARGAVESSEGKADAARATYGEVLRIEPDFGPGLKRLAGLLADVPEQSAKAYELAVKARKTLPGDVELARMLAKISFGRKEYSYAIQLLRESERSAPLDAPALYYLGASYWKMNDKARGKEALEKAVAAGLQEPLAGEAARLLAEAEPKAKS